MGSSHEESYIVSLEVQTVLSVTLVHGGPVASTRLTLVSHGSTTLSNR